MIMVEHDLDTIRQADHLIDIGPGAGHYGGRVSAFGSPSEIASKKETLTGQYLSGKKFISIPDFLTNDRVSAVTILETIDI